MAFTAFLGGTGYNAGNAVAIDSVGDIFLTGQTTDGLSTFPGNVVQPNYPTGASNSAFVALFQAAAYAVIAPASDVNTPVNIGSVPVGQSSLPQIITVTNTGTIAMNFVSELANGFSCANPSGNGYIQFMGGDNPCDFSISVPATGSIGGNPSCGSVSSLAIGATCAFTVTFTPSAPTNEDAIIWIDDTAINGTPYGNAPVQKAYVSGKGTSGSSLPTAVVSVVSSKDPSTVGDSVFFTATLTPVSGTPTGSVQFVIDDANFGAAVPLSGLTAVSSATTTLTPGERTVTAVYSGDSNFASSSGALLEIVNNPINTITVTPVNPSIPIGDTQQFVATGTFADGTSAILPSGGTWAAGNTLTTGVWGPMAAAGSNGLIYFFGGQDSSSNALNIVQTYTPSTGAWSSSASSMVNARYQGTAVAPGDGKIYVVGGLNGGATNYVEAYDPVGNSWTTKSPIPHPSACSVGGAIDGMVYVLTGCNGSSGYVGVLDVYNPATDTWTSLAAAPNAHGFGAGGVMGGKLYVVGGYNAAGSELTSALDVYNPQTNTWSSGAAMPAQLEASAGSVSNEKLYVVGGLDTSNVPQSSVYVYDPTSNAWSTAPSLPQGQGAIGLATLDGLFYAGGGAITGTLSSDLFEVLDVDNVTWTSATTAVATVPANTGLATGVSAGTSVITATSTLTPSVSGNTTLTVEQIPVTPSITASNKTYDGTTAATTACTLAGSILPADVGNVRARLARQPSPAQTPEPASR